MDITVKPISQIREDHFQEINKMSSSHQAFIDQIKAEIGQDYDNLHNPQPFLVSPQE